MVNARMSRAGRAGAVIVPAAVMAGVGLWGIGRGGMWRDEAVTFQVARRSVPQIWRLLHEVDAVHGLYYLLMHPVLALRADEVALRVPSVCWAVAATALVAAVGVRLGRPRVGLWAGLLYAVTPSVGYYAQEGRSYALVGAGVAGATLLFVRAVQGRGAWWPYGVVVAVTVWLHELAVFVLFAHAVTLCLARVPRAAWRRWAACAGGVGVVLLPVVVVSRRQAEQVAWLREPGVASARLLVREFLGPAGAVFCGCLLLAAVALPGALRRLSVASVGLPLMAVPPLVLMAVSQVHPIYHHRYVLYALAGAPLVVAAGGDRLAGAVRRLRPGPRGRAPGAASRPAIALAGVLAIALTFAHQLPLHREHRTAPGRPDNLALVSEVAARELRPGDPVVFLPAIGRRAALAYPEAFRKARDVGLGVSAPGSGTLYGREAGPAEMRRRLRGLDRLWLVAEPYALISPWYPRDPAERVKLTVVGEEFVPHEPRREFVRGKVTMRLYVRRTTAADPTRGPVRPSAAAGPPHPPPASPSRAPW